MALKLPISFPIFAPTVTNPYPNPGEPSHRPPTEIRFSRWNNANAEKFNQRRRTQKEIEDDIRRYRRFDSAKKIATTDDRSSATPPPEPAGTFKSLGSPSSPSRPSIPGKKSKYSKPPPDHPAFRTISRTATKPPDHPAFRAISRTATKPPDQPAFKTISRTATKPPDDLVFKTISRTATKPPDSPAFRTISRTAKLPPPTPLDKKPAKVALGDDGLSFVIDGAPFEFKYSYTETPKAKPIKLREPPYSPFGPTTMSRPWTGRTPLPSSKKKLKEFDSFVLPPPDKKGVKPIQKPGPYLPGTGPKYVQSREEILGEPLSPEEVKELVYSCMKTKRQLNMGRDGLTHNMLDNIHAHWKRRRVCKIKCKGVCTVDMNNVCEQLEERTGGKIIFRRGGVVFLFRGRNYNYKTRPRFPLMLWKPIPPVYPRLVQRAPKGLTLEEANEMRKKGRKLMPICKLSKNGVYVGLVKLVREAFEECELVRIDCQGVKGSDYKKIGAKLKELVPCVLISFENDFILMWRGPNWKSSLKPAFNSDVEKSNADGATSITGQLEGQEQSAAYVQTDGTGSQDINIEHGESYVENDRPNAAVDEKPDTAETIDTKVDSIDYANVESENTGNISGSATLFGDAKGADGESESMSKPYCPEPVLDNSGIANEEAVDMPLESDVMSGSAESIQLESSVVEASQDNRPASMNAPCTKKVLLLLKQAVESGSAVVLDDASLDADRIYERAVAFAQSAPPGPVFTRQPRKSAVEMNEKQEPGDLEVKEVAAVSNKRGNEKKASKPVKIKDLDERHLDVVPQGSLKIDELAKLLA
ncbi:hypothetical protein CCACVL1_11838 [Corchorus capsularis]|uniref:CRM domain-containing protein n=1 Tax=Corchorus capsularis TaxID=210143 RepID=A0A1R3IJA3_COCAP|nr:hypothetical protein CCACVL1_11838 [Corchorus capsularis]